MTSPALMTTPVHRGPSLLTQFAANCAEDLFCEVQHTFHYPSECSLVNWPVEQIKLDNARLLGSLNGCGNVYAIFVRPKTPGAEWAKVYVGQRKSSHLRERMTQHLIKKSDQTGSMLKFVKTAISSGSEIGVSFIKVEPESLRLFVEETIISAYKNELPWNTQS